MNTFIARTLVLLFLTVTALYAQEPRLINYHGRVAVGGVNFEGAGQFKFVLVDAAGTTTFWSNDGTSTAGSEPVAAVTLTVTGGRYSALLGDATLPNMAAIPASVFNNSDLFLRVWFNDGTNGSQLLTPDQRLRMDCVTTKADVWQQRVTIDGTPPDARINHTAVWTGSEMIVWGGGGISDSFNDTFSYTPNCGTFRVTSMVLNGGNLLLGFPTVTGRTYTLWRSDTLADGTWTNTGLTALAGTGATLTFTVPAITPARRFFRVQADP